VHHNDAWQPPAILKKKLNPTQQKYSAYDRELQTIYEVVKHFRHMLKARHFTIFTDHKPTTYAFQEKRDKCSLRQFNHLDFVSQFTTDIRHISGQDNVANALSLVESVTVPPSSDTLVAIARRRRRALNTLGVNHHPTAGETTNPRHHSLHLL
jgi:cleavage and polyadenylation specificity factor subunit 1